MLVKWVPYVLLFCRWWSLGEPGHKGVNLSNQIDCDQSRCYTRWAVDKVRYRSYLGVLSLHATIDVPDFTVYNHD